MKSIKKFLFNNPDVGSLVHEKAVRLMDSSLTTLPAAGLSLMADGLLLQAGDRVLFTNLADSSKNNRIYKVLEDHGNFSFVVEYIIGANPSALPEPGTDVYVKEGSHADEVRCYDGSWETLDLDTISGPTAQITNLSDPVNPQDAATKNYVDTLDAVQNTRLTALEGVDPNQNLAITNLQTLTTTHSSQISTLQSHDTSQDSAITALQGSTITALTSDVSATGPGSVTATVNSVGGSSAANIHSAELAANAATNSNTGSTIVKRDSSGNFSAGTITANLTGNASGSAASFTGSLSGDVTGTQSATSISSTTVTGKLLTGYTSSPGTVSATDSILQALQKLNGNEATDASNITTLTTNLATLNSRFTALLAKLDADTGVSDTDYSTSI